MSNTIENFKKPWEMSSVTISHYVTTSHYVTLSHCVTISHYVTLSHYVSNFTPHTNSMEVHVLFKHLKSMLVEIKSVYTTWVNAAHIYFVYAKIQEGHHKDKLIFC